MNWRWVSIAALLAALVAGYGAFTRQDPSDVSSTEAPTQPGYFLADAIITQTEKDGSPGIRLAAKRIDQQREQGSIRLTDVRVDFLKTTERPWVLTAQEGFVPEASRVIEFSGDVHLYPLDSPNAASLRTNALAIDTEKNIAYSTDSPVDIRYGRIAMTVKRFEADLNTEKIKLESVRGHSERG